MIQIKELYKLLIIFTLNIILKLHQMNKLGLSSQVNTNLKIESKQKIIILSCIFLLIYSNSLCLNGYSGCLQCQDLIDCKTCHLHHGLKSDKTCGLCANHMYCRSCIGDTPWVCTTCVDYFYPINGVCVRVHNCTNPYCVQCHAGPQFCQVCDRNIPYYGFDGSNCVPCLINNCLWCYTSIYTCLGCYQYYGIVQVNGNIICALCTDFHPQCIDCTFDVRYCHFCSTGYGVNHTQPTRTCVPCLDVNCANCGYNYQVCQICSSGYGLTLTGCVLCPLSPVFCLDCSNTNLMVCHSCPDGRYLDNGKCPCHVQDCYLCSNSFTCDVCFDGFYRQANATCSPCPAYCLTCHFDQTYSAPSCDNCTSNLHYLYETPALCLDFCGDFILITNQCDNELGRNFDGCTDRCILQDGFVCPQYNDSIFNNVTRINETYNFSGLCYFIGNLQLQLLLSDRQKFKNSISLVFSLQPPLYAFKIIPANEFINIFKILNDKILVKEVIYDSIESLLKFSCQFSSHLQMLQEIIIQFKPSRGSKEEYFDYNYHGIYRFELPNNHFFYTDFVLNVSKLSTYIIWLTIFLGWISCLLGLGMKRLAGLQAMFVLQYAWLTLFSVNAPKMLSLEEISSPLKYVSGYNIASIAAQQYNNQDFNSRFLYANKLINSSYFSNNFNISLVINILVLVPILFTFIRIRHFIKSHPKLKQNRRQIQRLEELVEQNELSFQIAMYVSFFNFMYFCTCATLFFKYGQRTNIASLILFSLQGIVYVLILIKFVIDPCPFDYFRFSFKAQQLAMHTCFFHILIMIITVVGLTLISTKYVYINLILPTLMLIYILAYRPYKEGPQNIRSALNYLTIIALIMFDIYFCLLWQKDPNQTSLMAIYIINLYFLLVAVVIVSIISTIYYFYYYKYILPNKQVDNDGLQSAKSIRRKQFLTELIDISDANQQMRQLPDIKQQNQNQDQQLDDKNDKKNNKFNIFKQIILPNKSLVNASHCLIKELKQLQKETDKFNQNYSSQRPIQLQNLEESANNTYRQFKNMVKAQQLTYNKKQLEQCKELNHLKSDKRYDNLKNYDSRKKQIININENHQNQQKLIMKQKQDNSLSNEKSGMAHKKLSMSVINTNNLTVPQDDYKIAEKILVDQGRFIQMRGAFDKVLKEMKAPVDPNANLLMKQFDKINAKLD